MTVWVHRALATGVMLIAAACGDDDIELIVDVKTDLVPGLEFSRVRTEYTAAGSPREETTAVLGDEDFIEGQRVAEFRDLAPGEGLVTVSLLDRAGVEVLRREISTRIERTYALTAVLTRSCRDVECPAAGGDPERTTCLGGRCISPACAADPAECPAQCDADTDCTVSVACAVAVCIDGSCFEAGLHERCQDHEFCDPDVGCVPRGTFLDGSTCDETSETDCADGDDEDCDGAPDCADPDCTGRECTDGNGATTGANTLLKWVEGKEFQFDLNANLLIHEFLWVGASYRMNDSVDGLVQWNITPQLSLGYSYGYPTSDIATTQYGTHEILVNFRVKHNRHVVFSPRYF